MGRIAARQHVFAPHDAPAGDSVPGRVYSLEPTGDVTFVQPHVDGAIVIVGLDPEVPIRTNINVWLEFVQNRLHLFDEATQMALTSPESPI